MSPALSIQETQAVCDHPTIRRWQAGVIGAPDLIQVWACEDCRVRFYPACASCVDIGHRDGVHPPTLDEPRSAT